MNRVKQDISGLSRNPILDLAIVQNSRAKFCVVCGSGVIERVVLRELFETANVMQHCDSQSQKVSMADNLQVTGQEPDLGLYAASVLAL